MRHKLNFTDFLISREVYKGSLMVTSSETSWNHFSTTTQNIYEWTSISQWTSCFLFNRYWMEASWEIFDERKRRKHCNCLTVAAIKFVNFRFHLFMSQYKFNEEENSVTFLIMDYVELEKSFCLDLLSLTFQTWKSRFSILSISIDWSMHSSVFIVEKASINIASI